MCIYFSCTFARRRDEKKVSHHHHHHPRHHQHRRWLTGPAGAALTAFAICSCALDNELHSRKSVQICRLHNATSTLESAGLIQRRSSVCLSVCPHAYLRNHTSIEPIFTGFAFHFIHLQCNNNFLGVVKQIKQFKNPYVLVVAHIPSFPKKTSMPVVVKIWTFFKFLDKFLHFIKNQLISFPVHGAPGQHTANKKLSYRRVTARCVLLVVMLPIAMQQCRNYLYDKSWPNRWYEVGDLVGGNAW